VYRRGVQATCAHLDRIDPDRPARLDVCPACVEIGSSWVHLRQCLVCGRTGCCDSSPNRHASKHARASGHELMQSLEEDETWAWCFVDELTLEPTENGGWEVVDPFFDAGLWYANEAIEHGGSIPFPRGTTSDDGFPLAVWESTYRGRHRDGTIDPDQARELEALPGWTW
jgi:hypothetical protein